MIIKFIFLNLLFFINLNVSGAQFGPIPDHLLECYIDNIITYPMTITNFIDIVRKIELNQDYIMDMRMVANSILKRFWRDGIVKDPEIQPGPGAVTYTTAGFQSYKYSLLYANLLPSSGRSFPNETININERCTLHMMLSGSVDPWERGDETETCLNLEMSYNVRSKLYQQSGLKKSECPIERGVLQANSFGTLNVARALGGIAMALQPMQVVQSAILFARGLNFTEEKYTNIIDNLWASTLSGDLAEVIVFQKQLQDKVNIGPAGSWNDSAVPVNYYLIIPNNISESYSWENTNAEILGSFDGLILANEAIRWNENGVNSLKLSQLLEMYYTNYDDQISGRANLCSRRVNYLLSLLDQREILKQQTKNFAELLAEIAPHFFVNNDKYISQNIDKVITSFMRYLPQVVPDRIFCPTSKFATPKLRLYIIYDSSWFSNYLLQFLLELIKEVDISYFGSNVTVINGASGDIVVDSAITAGDMYLQWNNASQDSKEAKSTAILRGFITLKNIVERKNTNEIFANIPAGIITLVIGFSSSITDYDYPKISSILRTVKTECPDMTFIYLTSSINAATFVRLSTVFRSQFDYTITSEINNDKKTLSLLRNMKLTPRSIVPPACVGSKMFTELKFEEYVTPYKIYEYRIHPSYLCTSNETVTIKLINKNYGNIETCISRKSFVQNETSKIGDNGNILFDKNHVKCETASLFDEIQFNIENKCKINLENQLSSNCGENIQPIFLKIEGKRSMTACSEKDCRFPDQIRFILIVNGLKCIKDKEVTCKSCHIIATPSLILFCLIIYLYLS